MIGLSAACLVWVSLCSIGEAQDTISFNEKIRPILAMHCINCHGPDEEHRQADLRLDVRDDALMAIEPNSAEDSELFARIISDDDDRMPPVDHADALRPEEIELIKKWIEQGANYETHWSFVKPVRSDVPPASIVSWGRNEIDRFVAVKLNENELKPSADGDPHRLVRRLALDLTGLPPTPKQVERFANDPTDATYESIVDELLDSPQYGEHWAAMWMDIARYADTMGYAEDRRRNIWPWRDWVIRAFNENMPYDQFTIEQLAGDLLPDATADQKLATAFHRNTLNNTEGGTSDEEFRTIAVKDRSSTTMNVWMGLTLRCAECHTHKYDPISQTEYYQFLDYFNQSADADRNDDRPKMSVYPKERWAEFEKIDREMAALAKRIEKEPEVWKILRPTDTSSRDGTEFKVQDDHSILPVGKNPRFDEYEFTLTVPAGKHTGMRLEVFPDDATGGNTGRGYGGAFVVNQIRVAVVDGDRETNLPFKNAFNDYAQRNSDIKNVIKAEPAKNGWAVRHPIDEYKVKRTAVFAFETVLDVKQPTTLKFYILHASPWAGLNIGRTRVSITEFEGEPAEAFRKKTIDPLRWQMERLAKKRNDPVQVPVMQDRPENQRRTTYVHIRGNYQSHGDKVESGVPAAFHPFPEQAPRNRLGIAKWIVSPGNPLTARVTVNRFWARLFGIGIVETEEDFGTQGMLPTNQPLLDWLAVDFQENNWDVKRLLKQIVMSSTYRQDNRATEDQLAKDPRNRFLARGPRFRLSAEVVRDQALAVSGLLSSRQYGPPVYPPSPIKRIVNAFTGGMTWEVSKGEDRNRRAVYTFLKRSAPHPLFDTFDMASRTVCNMRRIRTNTPLQSFMTLNDETFLDCAKALANQMRGAASEPRNQIRYGLETALLHPAKEAHLNELLNLYDETLAEYRKTPRQAELLTGGESEDRTSASELAAMTIVANVILNLDEFLTR
ncbi:MAG: PSD1 and planctomycete cytochrome C domain-containing protein [Planctomycetota bacterium]